MAVLGLGGPHLGAPGHQDGPGGLPEEVEEGAEGDLPVQTLHGCRADLVEPQAVVGRQVVVDPPHLDAFAGKTVAARKVEDVKLVDVVKTEEEGRNLQRLPDGPGITDA